MLLIAAASVFAAVVVVADEGPDAVPPEERLDCPLHVSGIYEPGEGVHSPAGLAATFLSMYVPPGAKARVVGEPRIIPTRVGPPQWSTPRAGADAVFVDADGDPVAVVKMVEEPDYGGWLIRESVACSDVRPEELTYEAPTMPPKPYDPYA